MRFGIGGGRWLARGGVSVGKSGVGWGAGSGPFRMSGGTGGRRPKRHEDNLSEAIVALVGVVLFFPGWLTFHALDSVEPEHRKPALAVALVGIALPVIVVLTGGHHTNSEGDLTWWLTMSIFLASAFLGAAIFGITLGLSAGRQNDSTDYPDSRSVSGLSRLGRISGSSDHLSTDREFELEMAKIEADLQHAIAEGERRDAANSEQYKVRDFAAQAKDCIVEDADLVAAESAIYRAVLGAILSEAQHYDRLPRSWDDIEWSLQWLVTLRGPDSASRLLRASEPDTVVHSSIGDIINLGTKDHRIVTEILEVVRVNPGILQTSLYDHVSGEPSDIRHICWYLDHVGDMDRKKAGRSYALTTL